jgi:YVTN family beta-propeller protein
MKIKGDSHRTSLALTAFLSFIIIFSFVEFVVTAQSASPIASYAYITNSYSNTVSIIDTATNKVIDTVNVGSNPNGVAVSPDGTKVYVTNDHDNTVSVINTETNKVIGTVNVGNQPKALGQFIGPKIVSFLNFMDTIPGEI